MKEFFLSVVEWTGKIIIAIMFVLALMISIPIMILAEILPSTRRIKR